MFLSFLIYISFVVITAGRFADAFKNENVPVKINQAMAIGTSNGMMGVASVAGVSSLNGKVTSIGGVSYFPPFEHSKITKEDGGISFTYPLKENQDVVGSGTVQMYPGSLFVSSSYNSKQPDHNPWPKIQSMFEPIMGWPVLKPPTFFETPNNLYPWFSSNLMNGFAPLKPDVKNFWLHPNLNPFPNLWQ